MSKLIDNIKRLAALIKGEIKSGGNTAARVGGLFEDIAAELENKYDKTEADRLITQHDTAENSHLNVQEMLLQKINDVRETLLAADQNITQDLTTHAGTKAIHKTSEEIRAEIVDEDIPETLARVAYVEREKAAILELARQYVTQGIAEVVGGAPDALNALNELAAAINNDPNFAASIMTQLNGKADSVHTHDKSQITDFPSSLPASDVYAWAKQPEKPAYTAAEIRAATQDHNHAGVYQPAGSYAAGAHTHSADEISDTSSQVMMTTTERSKLSGIAAGANNYTHPSTHPASMIAEETNKRFMTDAERSKLAGIESSYKVVILHRDTVITSPGTYITGKDTDTNSVIKISFQFPSNVSGKVELIGNDENYVDVDGVFDCPINVYDIDKGRWVEYITGYYGLHGTLIIINGAKEFFTGIGRTKA